MAEEHPGCDKPDCVMTKPTDIVCPVDSCEAATPAECENPECPVEPVTDCNATDCPIK